MDKRAHIEEIEYGHRTGFVKEFVSPNGQPACEIDHAAHPSGISSGASTPFSILMRATEIGSLNRRGPALPGFK